MFSLSILLPKPIDDALVAWSQRTPGATVDPQASHVTLLNFESDADDETLLAMTRNACRGMTGFRLVLDRAMQEPYLGKPGLNIVMLVPSDAGAGHDAVVELREHFLAAFSGVIDIDTTVPEDGEFLPHLTLTSGVSSEEAATLCVEAERLRIAFDVVSVSAWSSTSGSWQLLQTAHLALAA